MTDDKQARKQTPIASGCTDYFPDALAAVARVSFVGSKQHNPGEPMRWDRSKSPDHADCLMRHMLERGTLDTDGLPHTAKVAWRALAMLQVELENAAKEKNPIQEWVEEHISKEAFSQHDRNGREFEDITGSRQEDQKFLETFGCPRAIAYQIAKGITYTIGRQYRGSDGCMHAEIKGYCYLSGPMRGLPQFNFPAFDKARDELVKEGFNVISPADIDRAAGHDPHGKIQEAQEVYAFRDFHALHFLKKIDRGGNMVIFLPGWEKSTGANAELNIAKWLGLKIRGV